MNREILFRGKRVDGSGWIFGHFTETRDQTDSPKKPFICTDDGRDGWKYEIIPETIGQFTGLYTSSGERVFEGDILEVLEYKNRHWDELTFEERQQCPSDTFDIRDIRGNLTEQFTSRVYWEDAEFLMDISDNCQAMLSMLYGDQRSQSPITEFKIVGNIHDQET